MKTITDVLADPASSYWLKSALRSALVRDPIDAANDANLLSLLLDGNAKYITDKNITALVDK